MPTCPSECTQRDVIEEYYVNIVMTIVDYSHEEDVIEDES